MKVFIVGVILATIGFQSIAALKCMQGVEVEKNGGKAEQKGKEKVPELTECGVTTAVASTALLFAVKPSTISIPSGDYKCYHLKYDENNSETSTIIKGRLAERLRWQVQLERHQGVVLQPVQRGRLQLWRTFRAELQAARTIPGGVAGLPS